MTNTTISWNDYMVTAVEFFLDNGNKFSKIKYKKVSSILLAHRITGSGE